MVISCLQPSKLMVDQWMNYVRMPLYIDSCWYCSDFYGCVLWDMSKSAVEDVCIAWRKNLRRVWDVPAFTHARVITPLCELLQLKVELASCCVKFMANWNCLRSSNQAVEFVARQGIYFQRLYSPIGRNRSVCHTLCIHIWCFSFWYRC